MRKIAGLDKVRVTVGYHHDDDHEGTPTATIAAVHEFGREDGSVPPRPTLGPTADANAGKYLDNLRRLFGEAVEGKRTLVGAAHVFGSGVVADVKRAITALTSPPLADSTIARRKHGGTKPLIDTGAMRDQVGHEVQVKP